MKFEPYQYPSERMSAKDWPSVADPVLRVKLQTLNAYTKKDLRPFASGKACPVQHLAETSNCSMYTYVFIYRYIRIL